MYCVSGRHREVGVKGRMRAEFTSGYFTRENRASGVLPSTRLTPALRRARSAGAHLSWRTVPGSVGQAAQAYAGKENVIFVPFPASLSAQILPLCASTRYLAIDKPNPIPPESLDL